MFRISKYEIVPANTTIFKQYDQSDLMYVIVRGNVIVQKESIEYGPDPIVIATLLDGELFGEMSLVATKKGEQYKKNNKYPRNATCITSE